jgi:UDP-N-acetylmuramate dehydrogenase
MPVTLSPIVDSIRKIVRGEVLERETLAKHTSYRIGGPALALVYPMDVEDACAVIEASRRAGARVIILGHGTNVLFCDEGIDAIVMKTTRMRDIRVEGRRVWAQAGASLSRVLQIAMEHGLSGAEFMAGIPGTVGGAVAMNAGTSAGSMASVTRQVTVIESRNGLKVTQLAAEQAGFRYRGTRILDEGMVVTDASLELAQGDAAEIRRRTDELLESRRRTQPLDLPSAGSVFKNPPGCEAGRLIEEAGLKGACRGGAMVSPVHANFIVNTGGATASDVLALVEDVRSRVRERTGIELETEIKIVR